jgi:predicted nucleotidyltransferase component of viral defense system
MIPLSELNKTVARFNVPIDTVEKDYIISWILICLSKSTLCKDFVFYGGTAIKRIYFDDHRFSEDIDLISNKKFNLDYILTGLNTLKYAEEAANIALTIDRDSIVANKDRIQLFITYTGFNEIAGPPKQVRVDFVMDRDLFGDTAQKEILKSYSDISQNNTTLTVKTLNTILANKLCLLNDLTRNEPRDVFDIWFLLHRTDQFDYDFNRVRNIYKDKYCCYPSSTVLISCLDNPSLERKWESRLSKQIAELPNFKSIIADIKAKLPELAEFEKR